MEVSSYNPDSPDGSITARARTQTSESEDLLNSCTATATEEITSDSDSLISSNSNFPSCSSKKPPAKMPNTEMTQTEIQSILTRQDSRVLSAFEVTKLEKDAQKNWDIFYKRNQTKFFKDRQWTLKEFDEIRLKIEANQREGMTDTVTLLEIGCGVGNFVFPLLQELSLLTPNLKMYACDFSSRAVDFLRSNAEYNEDKVQGFVTDVTSPNCFSAESIQQDLKNQLVDHQIDFLSMIFVLSGISPSKYAQVIKNVAQVIKLNGIVFFRDYGRYDMAQLRFKPGRKIDENFYARRDGTRSYYFTTDEVESLFTEDGNFEKIQCDYIHRRTINIKEGVDVERIFVQGKFIRKK